MIVIRRGEEREMEASGENNPRRKDGPDYVTLLAVFSLLALGGLDMFYGNGGHADAAVAAIAGLVYRLYK
jgi:hypothetical protein